ncbi:MAG: T9SS type A sorting domain-containing protein [Bacteroidetes bacterium]|nr:T9SS type A sorting domain-containing protein [Bacteroidota bacterium]
MHVVIDNCNAVPQTEDQPFHLAATPNPSHGIFFIKLTGLKQKPTRLSVTDSQGKTVYSELITGADQFKKTLDISSDSKGIYLVKAESEKGSGIVKLVVR